MKIRKATDKDMATIAAFQIAMAAETEQLTLDYEVVNQGVKAVFDVPARGRYFVAENDRDEVIASLLITFEWSDWRNGTVFWLQSVYVLPEHRNKRVFRQMYEHIKALAQADASVKGIRLYVDKTNTTAQKVYCKIGMHSEHYTLYEWMKTK